MSPTGRVFIKWLIATSLLVRTWTGKDVPRANAAASSGVSPPSAAPPFYSMLDANSVAIATPQIAGQYGHNLIVPVSGTIILDIAEWLDNVGGYPPTEYLFQWLIDNQPAPGILPIHVTPANPSAAGFLDTTQLPDGTHYVSLRVIDSADTNGPWRAAQLTCAGNMMIVCNGGFITGAQTLPIVWPAGGGLPRVTLGDGGPGVLCDFISYAGDPPPVPTPRPYPWPESNPPVISPASPYSGNATKLYDASNWYSAGIISPPPSEYQEETRIYTTMQGGRAITGFQPQSGLTVEVVYSATIARDTRDGTARQQGAIDPFCVGVEVPDGSGFYVSELSGRISMLGYNGSVTTIVGYQQDPNKVPISPYDPTATEDDYTASKIVLGTIGTPGFDDFAGLNGIAVDPRNQNILYVCKVMDHFIMKIDLSLNPPLCTRYAGQDGVQGYADGAATTTALFYHPYDIILAPTTMPNGDPIGTMYVCDKYNHAIRKISADGSTVTTLAGGTVGPTPPGDAQLSANPTTYMPHSTVTGLANAYMMYPTSIDLFSDNQIMIGFDRNLQCRELNLTSDPATSTSRYITRFEDTNVAAADYNGDIWMWAKCDSVGSCLPIDSVVLAASNGPGSAKPTWVASRDGSVGLTFFTDLGPVPENTGAAGHYQWMIALAKTQAAILTNGTAYSQTVFMHRPRLTSDPPDPGSTLDVDVNFRNGVNVYYYGTPAVFLYGTRPSLVALGGPSGQTWTGLPTFDDLMATYPDDASLGAYIQAGFGGSVPRPDIRGKDLRDLIWWIRRTSLPGSYPTPIDPATDNGENTSPVVTVTSATRGANGIDGLSTITVNWMTDKPTYGQVIAGGPNSQSQAWNNLVYAYNVGQFEAGTSIATLHSVTIGSLPPGSPTHLRVVCTDDDGNHGWSNDITVT